MRKVLPLVATRARTTTLVTPILIHRLNGIDHILVIFFDAIPVVASPILAFPFRVLELANCNSFLRCPETRIFLPLLFLVSIRQRLFHRCHNALNTGHISYKASRQGVAGTGVCGEVTRFTGASRVSKPRSTTSPAISEAMLQ